MFLSAFNTIMHYMPIWLLIINIITFLVYRSDKRKAIRKKWRIPERTLILLALAGGGLGALTGMFVFHHKTKHPKFTIGVPCIILLHFVLFCLYVKYLVM